MVLGAWEPGSLGVWELGMTRNSENCGGQDEYKCGSFFEVSILGSDKDV